jgi:mRNA interferase YafQ
MRTRVFSSQFKRDYRKAKANPRYKNIDSLLGAVVPLLLADEPLPEKCRDHSLGGTWKGHRECHVCPDLLLVYLKSADDLRLVRLGSHSELF